MQAYDIKNELNMLDPKKLHIHKDEFNRLILTIKDEGKTMEIRPTMGFPLTNPDEYVSLSEIKDGKKDKEIGIIEDVGKLDSKSKKILREELKREYFMPRITKINNMKENHGIMKFDVETEKGPRTFETRYKEDIRKMQGKRVVIRDADGNRYEIKDYTKLDPKSITLLDSEI
ncbi:DUF1854 domain-containing protein [Candidatus Poribacteria bacterium]|nr:DUF1854 domain-containing protein [Candidatus Poribacteria bacterium]